MASKLGAVLLLMGIVCIGVSMYDFFTLDTWESPKYFWLFFVGLPLLFVGFVLTGSRIQRFLLNQQRDNIRETMKVVGEGLREGLNHSKITCTNCNHVNEINDNFCSKCGTALNGLSK